MMFKWKGTKKKLVEVVNVLETQNSDLNSWEHSICALLFFIHNIMNISKKLALNFKNLKSQIKVNKFKWRGIRKNIERL